MRDEYNFENSQPNPYPKKLRRQVTIRLNVDTIDYFKQQASVTGVPYQNLINLYLSDCAQNNKKLTVV